MLDLLNTIISYLVQGINHIISLITNIPVYLGYVRTMMTSFIPAFMLPFMTVAIIALFVIHIKRLVI